MQSFMQLFNEILADMRFNLEFSCQHNFKFKLFHFFAVYTEIP